MRDIKFRGLKQDTWVYFTLHQIVLDLQTRSDFQFIRTDTIGQYTGLKDKNGTEIYEGDIVNYDGEGGEVVEFENGCFWVGLGGELPAPLFRQMNLESMQVIGNIYENPELLDTANKL